MGTALATATPTSGGYGTHHKAEPVEHLRKRAPAAQPLRARLAWCLVLQGKSAESDLLDVMLSNPLFGGQAGHYRDLGGTQFQ